MLKNRFFTVISTILVGMFFIHSTVIAQEYSPPPQAQDAYKTFKFRVKWDGKTIPGITKVGGLTRRTEVVANRSGGDPSMMRKSPGLTAYEPIVLERRRTRDKSFEQWANKVWNFGSGLGAEVSLKDFRKDIVIELYNESGQLAMAFKAYRCWPSKYTALGDLDSEKNAAAIESITLEHEGWERDYAVAEPAEF
jgi:phage tail-like protein